MEDPRGVAVERSSGDVFVADTGNGRIDKFDDAGRFLLAFGWGVSNGAEELQTCATICIGGIKEGSGERHGPGEGQPVAVAADSAGNVYSAELHTFRVEKFSSNGNFLLMFGHGVDKGPHHPGNVCTAEFVAQGDACGNGAAGTGPGEISESGGLSQALPLAVDGEGDVWVGDVNRLEEFSSQGVFLGEVNLPGAGAVEALAVDAFGDFYVLSSEAAGVRKLEPSGTPIFTVDGLGHPRALTIDPSGSLFVSDQVEPASTPATILEFDPSGTETEAFGASQITGHPEGDALAIGQAAGPLYVVSSAGEELSAGQILTLPTPGPLIVSGSSVANPRGKTGATLSASIDPEGKATTYHFEYVDDAHFKAEGGFASAFTTKTGESLSIGEDFSDHSAAVGLSSGQLAPATVYHFRVVTKNANAPTGVDGEEVTFETLPTARVVSTSASHVTADAARLEAVIEPLGEETTYQFEYLTQQQFEAQDGFSGAATTSVPQPGASIAAGETERSVSQLIQSLAAGTTYRYRVVTATALGPSIGLDETFTTRREAGVVLPDGRQWEMVTPPNKRGALIEGIGTEALAGGGLVQAAADGGAITYLASQPTEPEPQGYDNQLQILSTRTPAGWTSNDVSPPHEAATTASVGVGNEYRFFTQDLSTAIVQPFGPFDSVQPLAPGEASEQTAFARAVLEHGNAGEACLATHCYRPLVTASNVREGTRFGQTGSYTGGASKPCPPALICGPEFLGASPDASHVVLASRVALTAAAPEGPHYLYEWSASKPPSEQLQAVSVLPSGTLVEGELGYGQNARNAISEDGSRVVWSTPSHVYIRDLVGNRTLQVGGNQGATEFQSASRDGSKVFFTDTQPLTAKAGSDRELYECAIVEEGGVLHCDYTDLTLPGPEGKAAVQGMMLGSSEDGSWVYFVANGVLDSEGVPVAGAVRGGCDNNLFVTAVCNLYVHHAGTTKLVAVVAGEDAFDWSGVGEPDNILGRLTARVSPNGQWLAFLSQQQLTGYDNRDAATGRPDDEVFVYDAAAEKVTCASCNPDGARPVGVEYGNEGENVPLVKGEGGWQAPSSSLAAFLPVWTSYRLERALYQSRYLDNNGRLFFDARDALVPQDHNETWDVYEWEPAGVGGCEKSTAGFNQAADACVGLISSGASAQESAFLDASENGGEVFFLTTGKLWPNQDFDNAYDIYDARVCTVASPCIPEPSSSSSAPCTDESCRPPATSPPSIFGAPATATLSGNGNVPPPAPAAIKPPPTRAQLLAAALRACHKRYPHSKAKRKACERRARSRYAVSGTAVKSKRSKRRARR